MFYHLEGLKYFFCRIIFTFFLSVVSPTSLSFVYNKLIMKHVSCASIFYLIMDNYILFELAMFEFFDYLQKTFGRLFFVINASSGGVCTSKACVACKARMYKT